MDLTGYLSEEDSVQTERLNEFKTTLSKSDDKVDHDQLEILETAENWPRIPEMLPIWSEHPWGSFEIVASYKPRPQDYLQQSRVSEPAKLEIVKGDIETWWKARRTPKKTEN